MSTSDSVKEDCDKGLQNNFDSDISQKVELSNQQLILSKNALKDNFDCFEHNNGTVYCPLKQLVCESISDSNDNISSLELEKNNEESSLVSKKLLMNPSNPESHETCRFEQSEAVSDSCISSVHSKSESAKNCSLKKLRKKTSSLNDMDFEALGKMPPKIFCLSKQDTIRKLEEIVRALKDNDTSALRNAAKSAGGLICDDIRRKVWPKLVGVDVVACSPRPPQEEIESHPYYQQVVLDVKRSLKRFPPSIHELQKLKMLDQLVILIMRVLCKHPDLHYYQGYHDICITFLLVLGEETAYHVVEKLSQTHLKVFMEKNMEPTIHLLEHIYILIGKKRPKFEKFLLQSEVGVAYCLSWLITWFSHVLNDYNTVVRFFDFFIVSHHWMPMYVTASLVLHREQEVVKQECEMASVHSLLCRIPDDLLFESLLSDSLDLFTSYTPKYLQRKERWGNQLLKSVQTYVPASLMIAAAVLVTAVIYQAYNY